MLKTASNVIAVAGGSVATVLFIVLFSQTGESSISSSLLMLLIGGIMVLICGTIGLLSSSKSAFLTCSALSFCALVFGFFLTNTHLALAVLTAILLFEVFANIYVPKEKPTASVDNAEQPLAK